MSALRPPVLDNRGLAEALGEHVQRFEQEHAIAVDISIGLDARSRRRWRPSCTGSPRSR
jgi:signal transduction histidine kinase